MKAYEIPNWLDGVKIRQRRWPPGDGYVYYRQAHDCWFDENGDRIHAGIIECMFTCADWEVYEEPKNKKTVTMYCPILKLINRGYHCASQWSDNKKSFEHGLPVDWQIVGWQEMQVTVDD